jgi:hypothetical protein
MRSWTDGYTAWVLPEQGVGATQMAMPERLGRATCKWKNDYV